MAIVFVHGVNNRRGPAYNAGVAITRALLREHLNGVTLGGRTLQASETLFPYWGDLATTFAWDMASLPPSEMETLGMVRDPVLRAGAAVVRDAGAGQAEPLVGLANRDFLQAVEMLGSLLIDQAPAELGEDVVVFVCAIQAYALANPSPFWLEKVRTDSQLIGMLKSAVIQDTALEQLGAANLLNLVHKTAQELKNALAGWMGAAVDQAGDFASTKLLGWTREPLNEVLGRFFGDIFYYFDGRGTISEPGPIPERILASIDKAAEFVNEPLVIIGHSLGGVISYDLISHYRPEQKVDLFVTVGSQVAHFEEMKLFHASDPAIRRPERASRPPNIDRWINVYDDVDVFAYAAAPVFDGVDVDARYDTKTYVIKSHGEYFRQERFYRRLRERIEKLG